jgi:hypothetical protein
VSVVVVNPPDPPPATTKYSTDEGAGGRDDTRYQEFVAWLKRNRKYTLIPSALGAPNTAAAPFRPTENAVMICVVVTSTSVLSGVDVLGGRVTVPEASVAAG